MTAQLVRVFAFLFACSIFLSLAKAASAESPQGSTASEPTGPNASPVVEKMLAEADRLAVAKQSTDSLKAADQALEAARQENDTAGEALAQQARAKALQDLQRTTEALAAWQAAQQMWARAGDTPEQIRALVQAGLLCVVTRRARERGFLPKGWQSEKWRVSAPPRLHRRCMTRGWRSMNKSKNKRRRATCLRHWR